MPGRIYRSQLWYELSRRQEPLLPGNSSDTGTDNDEREPGMLDAVLAELFNSDTEEEEFERFVE
jgi:hypothetical protein